jgi:hypothetical protein
MRNSLLTSGLSLSQAQSISNLCFQKTQEIGNQLVVINNSEKTLKIGNETYIETVGNPIPKNVVELILEKGLLHATQAFLMENIRAKDSLIKELKAKSFVSDLEYPVYPQTKEAVLLPLVDEKWGWNQLSLSEYNEYLEAESYAAHIGQFIHKGEKLDDLRKELPFIKTLEWMNIEDGKKTPLKVSIHHTSDQLLTVHNELAAKHRQYEQRVNYFKAKVKNLVTEENARISAENAVLVSKINSENELLRLDYNIAVKVYEEANQKAIQIFEQSRQEDIQKTSSLRIDVDPRFQSVIDSFLKQLGS